MSEAWYRNPKHYIAELAERNKSLVVWDRGVLVKSKIDPVKMMQLYFGKNAAYRVLVVGKQGTAELQPGRGMDNPAAVYPTWSATESLEMLEEVMLHPWGEDPDCYNADLPPDEKPVEGQEHRVVVVDLPPSHTGPGRALLSKLKELQEDYPDCILHLHGLYSYRVMFGMGFRSSDSEPRTAAAKKKIVIPAGKEVPVERTINFSQWITLLGFKVSDMKEPRQRCMYNIESAAWASQHYGENIKFKATGDAGEVTPTDKDHLPATTASHTSLPIKAKEGDKQLCDTCSLQTTCKYYRQGAVCSVPGAEPAGLARVFKTRDADTIIDGLGTLLSAQAARLERGMKEEETFGDLNPEVTKIANQVFGNGVKLAKLIDPGLTKPGVVVNVGSQQAVKAATPNQIMGAIVRELESRGIPRDQITPDMVQNLLIEMGQNEAGASGAVQAQAIASGQ